MNIPRKGRSAASARAAESTGSHTCSLVAGSSEYHMADYVTATRVGAAIGAGDEFTLTCARQFC
jgi:hypothetical protein